MHVEFSSHAKRFLKKVDKDLAKRMILRIEQLAIDPFPTDVKRIINKKPKVFRVRLSEYRIQFVVLKDTKVLYITDIDKRGRAYK